MVMKQYNQPPTEATVSAPRPMPTKSAQDLLIKQLQNQLATQQTEIMKLRRDIGKIKGEISDIVTVIKSRG
jgi:hypothetical protein